MYNLCYDRRSNSRRNKDKSIQMNNIAERRRTERRIDRRPLNEFPHLPLCHLEE